MKTSFRKLLFATLSAVALYVGGSPPAHATDFMQLADPVGGKQDVFQPINYPPGAEYAIHGVTQIGAMIVVNVTITGPTLVGATRIPVTLSPALASAPITVQTIFSKTTSAEDNVVAVTYDTATGSGFFVNLSGPAISGQVMHCLIFAP